MNKKKKLVYGMLIVALAIVSIVIIKKKYNNTNNKGVNKSLETKYIHASYGFDVSNLNNIVADADYVFVAKVNNSLNTVYKYRTKVEDKWISSPYTYYSLKVVQNIKGNLAVNKNIKVLKTGGRGKNSNVNYVYENDILPVKGQYYIFSAYIQNDGSLLISGTNSTIKIPSSYKNSSSYKKMNKAAKKGISRKRTRFSVKANKVYM